MIGLKLNRHRGMLTSTALLIATMLSGTCSAQTKQSTKDLEGWANTPSGQVWLRPGQDAYEHDTGLVRDLRTGQKTMPIRPDSIPQLPQVVVTPSPIYSPQPIYAPQPYAPQPIVVTPQPVYSPPVYAPSGPACPTCPNYRPNPYYSPGYRYDVGPYGNTAGQNFGFQSTNSQPLRNSYSRIK